MATNWSKQEFLRKMAEGKARKKASQGKYAHGGMTEHGLEIGDKITGRNGLNKIEGYNKEMRETFTTDLDKGKRSSVRYAKGGMTKDVYFVLFQYKGNVDNRGWMQMHNEDVRVDASSSNEAKKLATAKFKAKYPNKDFKIMNVQNMSEKNNFDDMFSKSKMAKGGKTKQDPPIVRGYFDDEPYEYGQGGEIGKELLGGQPQSEPKPSGAILLKVLRNGKEIIVSEDGGQTKERYVKSNGYSGYTLRYNGNQYEFTDSFAKGGSLTISDIKERTKETAPYYFSKATMKSFGQTMRDFKVKKMPSGKYLMYAPMKDRSSGRTMGYSMRMFNPETNKLDFLTDAEAEQVKTKYGIHKYLTSYQDGGMMAKGGSIKVNLGSGEMDLEDAIKMYEDKIKAQGRVTNERDENMLQQLKKMRPKMAKGGKTKQDPPIVRGFFDDEPYEYAEGGKLAIESRLPVDEQTIAERELHLFIDNDSNLYYRRKHPIEKNLARKIASGKFDINLAPKGFKYLIDDGIKEYTRVYGKITLTKNERYNLAKIFANQFLDDAESGSFDEYIPKKYRFGQGGVTEEWCYSIGGL